MVVAVVLLEQLLAHQVAQVVAVEVMAQVLLVVLHLQVVKALLEVQELILKALVVNVLVVVEVVQAQ